MQLELLAFSTAGHVPTPCEPGHDIIHMVWVQKSEGKEVPEDLDVSDTEVGFLARAIMARFCLILN